MYKQAVILLLMLFTASVSAALPARYMQTIENAAVWAQIGDKMVTVGNNSLFVHEKITEGETTLLL